MVFKDVVSSLAMGRVRGFYLGKRNRTLRFLAIFKISGEGQSLDLMNWRR